MGATKLYRSVLAALLGAALAGYATMAGAEPVVSSVEAAKGARGGGPQESIKVHGNWTIEVRNLDGTLAQRREFKNALTPAGAGHLAFVLSRELAVKHWQVSILGFAPGSQLYNILEPSSASNDPSAFKNLQVRVPTSGPNAGKLVLSGSATATHTANIDAVQTYFTYNEVTGLVAVSSFTQANLPTPIPVQAGQIIQVTVVISFS